ncbi:MAG: hypothetical protein JW768_05405 [Chitinispirillaceae bacterium]|nr:hypothetical protein [Chitinispirillaceae bacterium]
MPETIRVNESILCSRFSSSVGCDECCIAVTTGQDMPFVQALEECAGHYDKALAGLGLSDETAIFSRIFVSDILNQKTALLGSLLYHRLKNGGVSIIEQKPLCCGPLALFSYHILGMKGKPFSRQVRSYPDELGNDVLVTGNAYSLFMTANYTADGAFDAGGQTTSILSALNCRLQEQGMSLFSNGIRTWVFVRDIDKHYRAMVKARGEFFESHGLTDKTRYLASTGILGVPDAPEKIVSIDALSFGGLAPDQIIKVEALDHLSPAIRYGVTFERGLRVQFGDRSHLHISGTASIDHKGEVLYHGDAEKQTERTIENVTSLLQKHNAVLRDMVFLIVYIRNFHDRTAVEQVLRIHGLFNTPLIFTQAAVCRPSWLVEIEGLAIVPDNSQFPPFM